MEALVSKQHKEHLVSDRGRRAGRREEEPKRENTSYVRYENVTFQRLVLCRNKF